MAHAAHSTPPQSEHWHLSKEVGLSVIIAIVVQTVGLVWWARGVIASVEQRLVLLEVARTEQSEHDMVQDQRAAATAAAISARLDRIEDKLDRLIERSTRMPRP